MINIFSNTVKLILSLSISGSILALILFIIKPLIGNRLSKTFQYYIWLIVLARLILPLSFDINIVATLFKSPIENVTPTKGANIQVQNTLQTTNTFTLEQNTTLIQQTDAFVQAPSIAKPQNPQEMKIQPIKNNSSMDIFFIIWGLGSIISFAWYVVTYLHFTKTLYKTNKSSSSKEILLLQTLYDKKIKLYHNKLATTPILIGIFKPKIIIPDTEYNDIQLKNILLHELTHLKHGDIAIKWLMTLVFSIHWFNPLMYFIRNEMNKACELACDENVIKFMNKESKQSYGDTLISVVAKNPHPINVISATMGEDKNTLKERLVAIMNYKNKTKPVILISAVLVILLVSCAITLGAFTNTKDSNSSHTISLSEIKKLSSKGSALSFDDFKKFKGTNLSIDPNKYSMLYDVEDVYRLIVDSPGDGIISRISLESIWESSDSGVDIRTSDLDSFLNKNTSGPYSQELLDKLKLLKTPYIGDNSKVAAIASSLPTPDKRLKYSHIELQTESKPYGLTIYYEPINSNMDFDENNSISVNEQISKFCHNNFLLLFTLIDNLDEITININDNLGKVFASSIFPYYPETKDRMFNYYGTPDELWANNGEKLLKILNNTEFYQDEGIVINPQGKTLTLDDVGLLAQKGTSLTMEDFKPYKAMDKGIGQYALYYDLEYNLTLIVTADDLTSKPTHAILTQNDHISLMNKLGKMNTTEIRNKIVDRFVEKLNSRTSKTFQQVNEYLDTILSSPKESSDINAYIKAHKQEYDKILEMGYEALPTLIEILQYNYENLCSKIVANLSEEILASPPEDTKWDFLYKEGLMALKYWQINNSYLYSSSKETIPEFTSDEVAEAHKLVKDYFKDDLSSTQNIKRTLVDTYYDSQDRFRYNYRADGLTPEKIMVLKADFNIEYLDDNIGPWNEDFYRNWKIILVRENSSSPWKILDIE